MTAAEDPMLQAILAAGTRWLTIFGKSWDLHVTEGLKTSLENLAMIGDTIEYHALQDAASSTMLSIGLMVQAQSGLCDQDLRGGYARRCRMVVLRTPTVAPYPTKLAKLFEMSSGNSHATQLGIHTHNDSDTAVANALAAVMEGAKMVQGTMAMVNAAAMPTLLFNSQFATQARLHLYSGQTTS